MHVAIAQLNLTVGALAANAKAMLAAWRGAIASGARLVLTPELSLCGYLPEDLLLRTAFVRDCRQTLIELASQIDKGGSLLVGFPDSDGEQVYNAVALLSRKKIQRIYRKQVLNERERRYFTAANQSFIFSEGRIKFALTSIDELDSARVRRTIAGEEPQCLLVTGNRPYVIGDESEQRLQLARYAKTWKLPMIAALPVGGQDTQVMMGASLAFNAGGEVMQELPPWVEATALVQVKKSGITERSNFNVAPPEYHLYEALRLALRDYVHKNHLNGVVLGLSGGIDSALVCALAVDALGARHVHTLLLPSPYTSSLSIRLAKEMGKLTGVSQQTIEISPLMAQLTRVLSLGFGAPLNDLTAQNIQARLRGIVLMAYANQQQRLLLATGNKSEAAAGYATLYGDMAGGFAPIKDLRKDQVYQLARYRNALGRVIPEAIIERAPSAELKPEQTDQDSLPPYPVFDTIIEAVMVRGEDASTLTEALPLAEIERTIQLLTGSEYKRRQAAPGPCLSQRAFGTDQWRYPMTSHWQENVRRERSLQLKRKKGV